MEAEADGAEGTGEFEEAGGEGKQRENDEDLAPAHAI